MIDCEAQFGIVGLAALFFRSIERNDDQATIDLLAPIHPRGIFLPDIAALGKADAVEIDCIGFEPQYVAQFRPPLGHAPMQAMRAPGGIGAFPLVGSLLFGRREPALAEFAQPRIGHAAIA